MCWAAQGKVECTSKHTEKRECVLDSSRQRKMYVEAYSAARVCAGPVMQRKVTRKGKTRTDIARTGQSMSTGDIQEMKRNHINQATEHKRSGRKREAINCEDIDTYNEA